MSDAGGAARVSFFVMHKRKRSLLIAAVLLAATLASSVVSVYSGEGLPLSRFLAHQNTLTNTSNFNETHSTKNMSPELLQYILKVLGSMGVQAEDRNKMADPGEPLIKGSRLVWAATDNTNWVAHYEFVSTWPTSTNYCIAAALRGTNGSPQCCNGGYMRRFKDYKEFIAFESQPSSR